MNRYPFSLLTLMQKYRKYLTGTLGIIGLILPLHLHAEEQPQTSPSPGLRTLEQKYSYIIGRGITADARNDGIQLDFEALRQCILDQQKGADYPLTEAEMEALAAEIGKRRQAREKQQREAALKKNGEAEKRFLAENAQKPGIQTLPEGIQYRILKAGKGPLPKPDDYLVVHYEGRHLDGRVFDSSYARGVPLRIQAGDVIKGWQIVLSKMRMGDKWRVFIPARLAYGKRGSGDGEIEPGEMLIFDIELLNIEPEEKDEQE